MGEYIILGTDVCVWLTDTAAAAVAACKLVDGGEVYEAALRFTSSTGGLRSVKGDGVVLMVGNIFEIPILEGGVCKTTAWCCVFS